MPVSHIAASYINLVATGSLDQTVAVWDLSSAEKLIEFKTILDIGGQRLAIDPSGKYIVAGAYRIYGVAGYSVTDGSIVWQRKDLKKIQSLRVSSNGKRVYCGFSTGPCQVLDITSGETVESWRGVRDVYEHPCDPIRITERNKLDVWQSGILIDSIKVTKFAILDVAFGDRSFCISECTGPVRCFDISSTKEIWRYFPIVSGSHILQLGFSNESHQYFGIEWCYEKGGFMNLFRFDQFSGATEYIRRLSETKNAPGKAVFCLNGNYLLTCFGELLRVNDGKLIKYLPFPAQPAAEADHQGV
jgi:WD40 repeat protein